MHHVSLSLETRSIKKGAMSKKDSKKSGEKEAETDPFLLATLTRYKLAEYPDPASFSGPPYVVTVKLWPGYLLIKDAKCETSRRRMNSQALFSRHSRPPWSASSPVKRPLTRP